MSPKIYILTDDPYHDNEVFFGAYSTLEKAREAMANFKVDPKNNWAPSVIVAMAVDVPASIGTTERISGSDPLQTP